MSCQEYHNEGPTSQLSIFHCMKTQYTLPTVPFCTFHGCKGIQSLLLYLLSSYHKLFDLIQTFVSFFQMLLDELHLVLKRCFQPQMQLNYLPL